MRADCLAPGEATILRAHMPAEHSREREQQTLLILGAAGDLTARLLLPGLGTLLAGGAMEDLLLIGSGRDGALEPARALHGGRARRTPAALVRGRGGRGPGPRHRDARRGRAGGGHVALGGCAVPAALGQGDRRAARGGGDHVQASAASPGGAHGLRAARPAAPRPRPPARGAGPQHQRRGRPVRARGGHARGRVRPRGPARVRPGAEGRPRGTRRRCRSAATPRSSRGGSCSP